MTTTSLTTSLYILELQEHAKAEHERHADEAKAAELVAIEAAEGRLAPLADRLGRLLAKLPPDVRSRGIGISQLVPLLRGRQGRQAHAGEVAAALRSHGYTPRRDWPSRGSAGGARSRWFPPKP